MYVHVHICSYQWKLATNEKMLLSVNISCANTHTFSLEKLCGTVAVGTVSGSREVVRKFSEQFLSPEKLTGGTVPVSREAVPVWWRDEYLFLLREETLW
jgi:hypothetical protein